MELATRSNSRVLLVLALVFIAPVILAKLFLSMHWYQGGVTNHGQLLPEKMSYQSLDMKNPLPHKWQVLYLLPDECHSACQQQLYVLNQSVLALGKEKSRVTPVVLHTENSDVHFLKNYHFAEAAANSELANLMRQQQMVVVDPLGKLVMRYALMSNKQQQIMQGKALLSDMQKMLKMSRVG